MDLNTAAARLESHIRGWRADGLQVSDVLWAADARMVEVRIASPSWQIPLTVIQLYESGLARVLFLSAAETIEERHQVSSLDEWSTVLTGAVTRAARVRHAQARLLTSTCTTGWLDWIHGRLWLLPEGLLRMRGDLMTTLANGFSSGLTAQDPYRPITYDPATVLAAHPTNKLIPFAGMATARLHGGLTTSGLEVVMTNGTRHKLLWTNWDPARRLLRERLLPLLGTRLTH
jgi:hypothetical protein